MNDNKSMPMPISAGEKQFLKANPFTFIPQPGITVDELAHVIYLLDLHIDHLDFAELTDGVKRHFQKGS